MKEVTAIMPRSLKDITLGQYQRYEAILEDNKGAEQERFVQLKMVEIFCGISYEEATQLRLVDFAAIVSGLYDVLIAKPDLVQSFKLADTEFGFIPDLENMRFGEYVDLEGCIGNMQEIHKAMAVLYRPIKQRIKKKYILHDYDGEFYHEIMKSMPMDAVTSSMLFFWRLGIDCLTAILKSSDKKAEAMELLQTQILLPQNGDGTLAFTSSLATILQDLTQLRKWE